jgi:ABC-type antimicrobial peptide transport system permease subunit
MSADISAASDEIAVLNSHPAPVLPEDEVLASRNLESGRYGNLVAKLKQLGRRPVFVIGLLFVIFVIVSAIVPSWFSTGQPDATHPAAASQSPSFTHVFGTDQLGRDLWTRVLYGSSLTIEATITAIAIGLVAGLSLGVVSGFFGGWIDAIIMRIVDVLLAIPSLLFALAIVTAVGYGTFPVALAIGLGIIPGFARGGSPGQDAAVCRGRADQRSVLAAHLDPSHPAELLGSGRGARRSRRGRRDHRDRFAVLPWLRCSAALVRMGHVDFQRT